MKSWLMAGAGVVLMSGIGVAMAQAPAAAPPPPPPGAGAPQAGGPGMEERGPRGPMGPMGGPGMEEHFGWRHRMAMRHMPPPPSKAAHFRLRKGDAAVDVKCADDEPTKACVDAAAVLMDKAAAQR